MAMLQEDVYRMLSPARQKSRIELAVPGNSAGGVRTALGMEA